VKHFFISLAPLESNSLSHLRRRQFFACTHHLVKRLKHSSKKTRFIILISFHRLYVEKKLKHYLCDIIRFWPCLQNRLFGTKLIVYPFMLSLQIKKILFFIYLQAALKHLNSQEIKNSGEKQSNLKRHNSRSSNE
jgi:hypothetical protein